ncbi:MAG TPA: sporulation integral membrane protein YlbJ [Clostridiales bacterium]|nr:sporulation integral membrane protein YlbJ [Clostridia bacterium]HCS72523.1 sporulation integral membrane protein YlbJ [Clostridiales bacterium]
MNKKENSWMGICPGLIALAFLAAIFFYPVVSFQAALSGLNIFLQSVFPALLPFFICSEVMIGLGMVDLLSVLLNPVMKPIFRCPGSSSFVWIMSITSGYPTGARLTSELCKQKRITSHEAQRILSFCSTSGPLFMVSAVGIGMLGSAEAGRIILISHYLAALLTGFAFRFYKSRDYLPSRSLEAYKHKPDVRSHQIKSKNSKIRVNNIHEARNALLTARKNDGRHIGQLMGDAVRNSVNTLLVVGGFIIFFSVIIAIIMLWFDHPQFKLLAGGLFEVTTGSKLISKSALSIQAKIAVISFMIGWSGLSIHAQSASLLSGTGVRMDIFMLGKLLHGLLSAALSIPIGRFIYPEVQNVSVPPPVMIIPEWKEVLLSSFRLMLLAFLLLALFALTVRITLWVRKKAAF